MFEPERSSNIILVTMLKQKSVQMNSKQKEKSTFSFMKLYKRFIFLVTSTRDVEKVMYKHLQNASRSEALVLELWGV